jgi:hypothetical protein
MMKKILVFICMTNLIFSVCRYDTYDITEVQYTHFKKIIKMHDEILLIDKLLKYQIKSLENVISTNKEQFEDSFYSYLKYEVMSLIKMGNRGIRLREEALTEYRIAEQTLLDIGESCSGPVSDLSYEVYDDVLYFISDKSHFIGPNNIIKVLNKNIYLLENINNKIKKKQ